MSAFTRRTFIAGTGAVGLGALLAACMPGGASGGPNAADGAVDLWMGFNDGAQKDVFDKIFVKGFSGGDVKLTVKPLDAIDRLTQTALAAGKGPDIVLTNGPSQVATFQRAGYLADLTAEASTYGWADKFAGWALTASKVDGKLASMPGTFESMVLYSNSAVFDELGVPVPTTKDEFEEMCRAAVAKGIVPVATGAAEYAGVSEWHVTFALNHYAGPEAIYSALRGETKWTDPVFVEAIELLNSWFQQGWFGGSVESYFSNTFAGTYSQFATGKAATMVSGTWEVGSLGGFFSGADAKGDWNWQSLPSLRSEVPKELWALGIGQTYGINAKSGDRKLSGEYLDYLLADIPALMQALTEVGYPLPPLKFDPSDFPADVDERFSRVYTVLPASDSIGYTTWTFLPQKSDTYIIDSFQKVLVGSLSAKDFCAGLQEQFAAELAAGQVPPAPAPGAAVS